MATNAELETINEISLKYPKKYKVLILNDDYTSMEFVIDVLMSIFHKSFLEAEAIMLEVHKKEKGVCGVYTHEIAETKVMQVHKKARDSGFPLRAQMEEE
ncbi:MAG: ATP-dependent Clp protease adaptor ClpS [Sulfurimonas sp. RIFCSPLOWO2_12_FULL_36_74]|jgi:ATP-dependent Clp protease adaptor protein ClpS|uniref:ATP-dependent Clp protease adaptor ClpS n=1 Tax=unclassified Sulfurimonas TaxID=2623549 RepID=UPI0008D12D77|nr:MULTISPECIES: ATP-dependent Clp protease adaptor ClpS [unclassified Sulfurimonas]OHE00564.1 MAG: ATP-dependent Clp protease adaptor ClpS [Sulfurimonas sp. RIFCSPLOWO2_02_FULL_36_28]OHE01221.1 MAG: ATP-dependent Clp protease adaptor ClpS [Sulfurimonas sp. RIFCSPLOWO2_12_36_12]OHE02225.1 MAG: ATP-dependent Clp protease adaptor ClpS [Sulfurimonas sp. RIFCSPLOWO2_12_FULL_36_74]